MLRRVVWLLLAFPALLLLVAFAVANRYKVVMVLNPFAAKREVAEGLARLNPVDDAAAQAAVEAAGAGFGVVPGVGLFVPLFGACLMFLALGAVLGGLATWLTQSQWRRMARTRTQEAHRWRAEAQRLTKERDEQVAAGGGAKGALALTGGTTSRGGSARLGVAR